MQVFLLPFPLGIRWVFARVVLQSNIACYLLCCTICPLVPFFYSSSIKQNEMCFVVSFLEIAKIQDVCLKFSSALVYCLPTRHSLGSQSVQLGWAVRFRQPNRPAQQSQQPTIWRHQSHHVHDNNKIHNNPARLQFKQSFQFAVVDMT